MAGNQMSMGEGTLPRAARLVADAHQDFDRLSSELEARIAGLRGAWSGAGGRAFFGLHQAWTERQQVVVGALAELEASLVGTDRDLTGTDEAQASTFSSFRSRLG